MQDFDRGREQPDFFDELPSWSRIKLRSLEKYLKAYLNKRGSANPRIFYLDGFAGQGYYGEAGQLADEGSALRIARLAQRIKDEDKPYRLFCLNAELDTGRCRKLQRALVEIDPELVRVYCGALEEHMPTVLAKMNSAPAFCFLDPWGVVGISPEQLTPLLQRPDTEVLINFSTRTLHRLAGSANSSAKEALGKVAQLSRTLGDDPRDPLPEWLRKRKKMSSGEWEDWAVERYKSLLQRKGPHLKYSLSYPVRPTHNGGVKYYLIFASRAMHGFPIMTDLICSEDDDLALRDEMSSQRPGQMSFLPPAHVSKRQGRYDTVIEEIFDYGKMHQGCTITTIIQEFSYRHLGEFRQRDIRLMVDRLVVGKRAEFGMGHKNSAPITFR